MPHLKIAHACDESRIRMVAGSNVVDGLAKADPHTAQEGPTGVWRMMTPEERQYGVVDIRRRGGDIDYRVEHGGEVLGFAGSLKLACYKLYMAELQRSTGRNGPR